MTVRWEKVSHFVAQRSGCSITAELQPIPLLGGLESAGVFKLAIRSGKSHSNSFVVKRLVDRGTRELLIYQALAGTPVAGAMPRLLGAESLSQTEVYMYLELLSTENSWPWGNVDASVAVLEQLAKVHAFSSLNLEAVRDWDYEADIQDSAESTVELFASLLNRGIGVGERPMLRPLERMVTTLPAMRRALDAWHKPALLHGDVHSGNIAWRTGEDGVATAVLLDWGRARIGSPLEDVSSWLQSLGCWEWEVKRRHDSLFRSYLRARQVPDHLSPELRQLYWMAAACNAMAGALRYHLAVLGDPARSTEEQFDSSFAAQSWLRIIRRADESWRN